MNAMDKARAELAALQGQIEGWTAEREALETKIRAARTQASEIEMAIRVMTRFEQDDELPLADKPPAPSNLAALAAAKGLTNREAVYQALAANSGSKVSELVAFIEKAFAKHVNSKTAGNILWMLKNEGVARRDGQSWYYAKEDAPHEGGALN